MRAHPHFGNFRIRKVEIDRSSEWETCWCTYLLKVFSSRLKPKVLPLVGLPCLPVLTAVILEKFGHSSNRGCLGNIVRALNLDPRPITRLEGETLARVQFHPSASLSHVSFIFSRCLRDMQTNASTLPPPEFENGKT